MMGLTKEQERFLAFLQSERDRAQMIVREMVATQDDIEDSKIMMQRYTDAILGEDKVAAFDGVMAGYGLMTAVIESLEKIREGGV